MTSTNDAQSMVDAVQGMTPPTGIGPDNSAVLILTGGGADENGNGLQDWRISNCPWEAYSNTVLVAGTRGDPDYTGEQMWGLMNRNGELPDYLMYQGYHPEMNAVLQTTWATDLIYSLFDINHVYISTADYYGPRGALTFIANWLKTDDNLLTISLLPTTGEINRKLATDTSQTASEELEKIIQFSQGDKPDVASPAMLERFIEATC